VLKFIRDAVVLVMIAVFVFLALQATVQASVINGSCMEPNLYNGQRIVINKAAVYFDEWERGEVIVFQPPESPGATPFIKRVIGLPGETVEVRGGEVFVDGRVLDEAYIAESPNYTMEAIGVPEGHYFVLGDNRNHANDSHTGWTVPRENILGKAWFTVWPLYFWDDLPVYTVP
jgi:signal peptidase I